MTKTKKIFALLTIIIILLSNSYIYAGVTDVTGGSKVKVNTTVVPHYDDYQVTNDINLEKDKDYIIDFTKEDNLSKALSAMSDLEGTVYYKIVVNDDKASLIKTEDNSEAIIKIVGNKQENKAVMTLINLDENKSYNLNFSYINRIGSKLTYNSTDYGDGKILVEDPDSIFNAYEESESIVINETRDDYYSRYFFNCKLNIIAIPTQDIEIEGIYNGFGMEISLNDLRVGTEAANIKGIAKGYTTGKIKNKITIQLAYGDGKIGSVCINGKYMTLANGTTDRAEFEVEPAKKYEIIVTKSKDNSNVPKTMIWDSDKTNNPSIKDNELLKNGTIEILDIKDSSGNSVGLDNVKQDLDKNNGWASIVPGSKVILRLKPNYGYQLTSITINDKKLEAGEEQSTFEYIMQDTNVHISGIFEKVDDKVNTKSDKVKNGVIELNEKEINLSKEQISNFEKNANGYHISSYLNINLSQVIYKGNQENIWENELRELNNPAKITLKLEDGIDGNEVVIVHEKHDGTYEIIPTTYDSETNTIIFSTTSFSNYAIASKTVAVQNDQKDNTINPKTGDNVRVYIVWFIIAILGIITLVIVNTKKGKKSRKH